MTPDRVREVSAACRDTIVSAAERVLGYSALFLPRVADEGRMTALTLQSNEDAVRESERPGGPVDRKIRMLTDVTGEGLIAGTASSRSCVLSGGATSYRHDR